MKLFTSFLIITLGGCISSLPNSDLRGKWVSDYKAQGLICPGIYLSLDKNECEIDFLPSRCVMGRVPPNVIASCSLARQVDDQFILTNLTTNAKFLLAPEGDKKISISPIFSINGADRISDSKYFLIRENDL